MACAVVIAAIPSLSGAEGNTDAALALRMEMERRIALIAGDENERAKAIKAGRERAILCAYCHGVDGNGKRPEIPKLAGQNPVYLLDQIEKFSTGERKERVMQELSASFAPEDKVKIALYYASVKTKPSGGDPDRARKGQSIFHNHCVGCHGVDGRGKEGYARLAGQQPQYVVKMLREFRDRTGRRSNPWMTAVALHLSDDDMRNVAAYVASLP
jgi:cytochrome c553